MKRISSLLTALLFALVLTSCAAAEKPVMRIGLFTDTHWKESPETFRHTEAALKVFKREKVDGIWHLGDIANVFCPPAYRYYRQTLFPKIFPENPPQEFFVYANHDVIRRAKIGGIEYLSLEETLAAVQKELGVPNAPNDRQVVRGYPVLLFQQFATDAMKEKALAETARTFPDKPIFVLDHCPAVQAPYRDLSSPYCKYPQVIHIYGHIHEPVRNENSIWQGTHTQIGAGCLYNWGGTLVGSAPPNKIGKDFAIMDVFPDKIVVRRFTVETGEECAKPWIFPLPFDPKTAPYRPEVRKANTPAPAFAAGASLTLTPDRPFASLKIAWPEANGEVWKYHVRLERKGADGKFRPIARQDCFSEFHIDKSRRTGRIVQTVSAGFFDTGSAYRIEVTPAGFFGQTGAPIAAEFTPPEERLKTAVVFESRDPMKELKVTYSGSERPMLGTKAPPLKDGFYQQTSHSARIFIPKEAWLALKGGSFRFTLDLDTRQEAPTWSMALNSIRPFQNANLRVKLPAGENIGYRYVIESAKKRDPGHYYSVLINRGGPGEFRINYVKLEKLP